MPDIKNITISLNSSSYKIYFGDDLLKYSNKILYNFIDGKNIIIIYDEAVEDKLNELKDSIIKSCKKLSYISVKSGESSKSIATLDKLLDQVLNIGLDRKTIIIALGGGVIGDLVGFAASILLRGISFIQIPTTLLSQVDSSIGGKTGVNAIAGKNLIGSFHQPIAVLSDQNTLKTLTKRDILSGYSELVKHALIYDLKFFEWLEVNGPAVINDDSFIRREAIIYSCKIKAAIIKDDEFEYGQRAFLNLGHTFAHAIESSMSYNWSVLHGEAVAIGIILAFKLAVKIKLCNQSDLDRITKHFKLIGLHITIKSIFNNFIDPKKLWELMKHDKKVSSGNINFILPVKIGEVILHQNIKEATVVNLLREEFNNE